MTAALNITYVHAPDADLDWLNATVKQYDFYIRGELSRPHPNRRAVEVLTDARDRYARLASRLAPPTTFNYTLT
jgi:hypothetical protein